MWVMYFLSLECARNLQNLLYVDFVLDTILNVFCGFYHVSLFILYKAGTWNRTAESGTERLSNLPYSTQLLVVEGLSQVSESI